MENEAQRRCTDNQYEHLKLVLSFFPRADAKTQFLTGLYVAMLGFLVAAVDLSRHWSWIILTLAVLAAVLLFASLAKLYQAAYPNLHGGEASLIYFNEIAKLRESTFLEKISALDEGDLFEDLAAQTWRNSKILSEKFAALKDAHGLLLWAVVPWLFATGLSIALKQNPHLPIP